MTLLSELTAILLPAAARDLRERGAAGELRADDLVSISRLLDVAAELVAVRDMARGAADSADDVEPLDEAKRAAASDLEVIAAVERRRASRT